MVVSGLSFSTAKEVTCFNYLLIYISDFRRSAIRDHVELIVISAVCCGDPRARVQICSVTK